MNYKVYIAQDSIAALGKDLESLGVAFREKAKAAVQVAAAQAHGFIIEHVQSDLHGGSREIYLQNLVGPVEAGDGIWMVALRKGAEFIEDDVPPHSMLHDLTHGPKSKINKKGQRYNVIPFGYKSKSSNSPTQASIVNYVKSELKNRGLDKIIKDSQGNPRTGKVATVNLTSPGAPWSRHNTPLLSGLTVYQRLIQNQKTGKTSVKRDVMTFRTASESQEGTGKWFNKGRTGVHIFDKVEKQVDEAWNKIMNELIQE